MPVHIEEMVITTAVVEPQALLTPAVLEQIVQTVLQRLGEQDRAEASRSSERDLRSVVERQRSRGGPR